LNSFKTHIIFKILSVLVVLTLLIPTGVKLIHASHDHEQGLCDAGAFGNIHECEFDCSLFKYNLQHYYL